MKTHADSQITDQEATRLIMAALTSPDQASLELVEGKAMSAHEMLGRWTVHTPEGPIHEVALVGVLDGEPQWSTYYREEADAISVWHHVVEEAHAARESPTTDHQA